MAEEKVTILRVLNFSGSIWFSAPPKLAEKVKCFGELKDRVKEINAYRLKVDASKFNLDYVLGYLLSESDKLEEGKPNG